MNATLVLNLINQFIISKKNKKKKLFFSVLVEFANFIISNVCAE